MSDLTSAVEALLAVLPKPKPTGFDTYYAASERDAVIAALASQAPSEGALQPVGEIVAEDMGRPFNAIQIRCHFYTAVPPIGTKLFAAIAAEAAAPAGTMPDAQGGAKP